MSIMKSSSVCTAYRSDILVKALVNGKSIAKKNAVLKVVSSAQGGSSRLESLVTMNQQYHLPRRGVEDYSLRQDHTRPSACFCLFV